jgi:hypothetical protein
MKQVAARMQAKAPRQPEVRDIVAWVNNLGTEGSR